MFSQQLLCRKWNCHNSRYSSYRRLSSPLCMPSSLNSNQAGYLISHLSQHHSRFTTFQQDYTLELLYYATFKKTFLSLSLSIQSSSQSSHSCICSSRLSSIQLVCTFLSLITIYSWLLVVRHKHKKSHHLPVATCACVCVWDTSSSYSSSSSTPFSPTPVTRVSIHARCLVLFC